MGITIDVFRSNAFSSVTMSDAINRAPFKPGRIEQLELFEVRGVPTTRVAIEELAGQLRLVPNTSRLAGPNEWSTPGKRVVRVFECTHLPLKSTIQADDFQNVRKFGSTNELQGLVDVVNGRLIDMRQSLEVTIEHLRMGALRGVILDADGVTVIYNLYTEFGIVQPTMDFALDNGATEVRTKALDLKSLIETRVGGLPMDHVHVFCSPSFFRALINHANVKAMYERWQDGEALRNDPRSLFNIGGVIFEEVSTVVAGNKWVPDDKARAFPVGVPGAFIDYRAPANWVETANTVGLPIYSKQAPMPFDAGLQVAAQANPLPVCTMPDTLVELSI